MANGIQNTLSGQNVESGFDQLFADLPPEALEAVRSLLSIESGPASAEQVQAAQPGVDAAFAELQALIQGQQAPADVPVPEEASPNEATLAHLAANLASFVSPELAEPARTTLAQRRTDRLKAEETNRTQRESFRKQQTEQALNVAAQMASESLKAAIEANDDKAVTDKALQMLRIQDALERRRQKEHDLRTKNNKAGGADGPEPIDPDELDAIVESVTSGETELSNYPIRHRSIITKTIRDKGLRITPVKVRQALNEVSSAKTVIDEIASIVDQIDLAKTGAMNRGIQGTKNLAKALEQEGLTTDLQTARAGLAGNLARAISAERGVLTDQDRRFALNLIPDIFDTKEVADRKIERLRRFIEKKEQAAIKTYMSPMRREGGGKPSGSNDSLRIR